MGNVEGSRGSRTTYRFVTSSNLKGSFILLISFSELRKWADSILIAPLDANTLGKVANGLSDNLLTSVLRAWDFSKIAYFAPAMNTCMWEHPLTGQHLKTLKELLLFKEIPPMEKELMCGDKGYGAMATLGMIVSIVSTEIRNKFAVYSQ